MERMKSEKGVTLVALIITVIVLGIIASISIGAIENPKAEAKENKGISEMYMIQHVLLERYKKWELVKDDSILVGTKISTSSELATMLSGVDSTESPKVTYTSSDTLTSDKYYYRATPEQLENLGVTKIEDTYIINYYTGEVFNETQKLSAQGSVLYIYSRTLD